MTNTRQQAPWNYQCPYRHDCPHLGGLSTRWVWREYQHTPDENNEHWRVRDFLGQKLTAAGKKISELERENEDLKAQLAALHRRQFKTNKKSSTQNISRGDSAPAGNFKRQTTV